jgi:amino acid transporter
MMDDALAPKKAEGRTLLRSNYLSALENVAQSIGTVGPVATIGTILPLLIYKSGNGTWLLFLGILGSFCLISTSINVFASRFASAGSLSAFAEIGLGKRAGSLTGWSYAVAMVFIVTSSAVSCAYYVALVVSHFTHTPFGTAALVATTVAVTLAAWWPSHRDIMLSTKIMLGAEAVSMAIILVILCGAMFASHRWIDTEQLSLKGVGFPQFRAAFVLAFMTLAGFESVTTLGEEAKAATHSLPRAMMLCLVPVCVLFTGTIYCLTALSHSRSLALDQTDAPLDLVAQSLGLPTLGWMSSLGVAISCFGCMLGGFNAGSRVIYSMARNGEVWKVFEAIHPANGTPSRALGLLAAVSIVVPTVMIVLGVSMSDAMDYLIQIASFGFLGAYLLVCVAAPAFLSRHSGLGVGRIAIALAAMAVIGAAFFMSLVPVPDGPWRYLPYIYAGLLLAGMVVSGRIKTSRGGKPVAEPTGA